MNGNFHFERNGMSVRVVIQDGHVVCSVDGAEVLQLVDKATGKVSLAGFAKAQGSRTFVQTNQDYFSQKIS